MEVEAISMKNELNTMMVMIWKSPIMRFKKLRL